MSSLNMTLFYDVFIIKVTNRNKELTKASQHYFAQIIDENITKSQTVFDMVEKLTNLPKLSAPEPLCTEKCNDFFNGTKSMRQNIDKVQVDNAVNHSQKLRRNNSRALSASRVVDQRSIEESVLKKVKWHHVMRAS